VLNKNPYFFTNFWNFFFFILQQPSFWNAKTSSSPPGSPLYGHTATLDKDGTSIYYIGGRNVIYDSTKKIYNHPFVSMGSILVFHTETTTWETKNVGGSVIPQSRTSHSATLCKINI
jgi:hypothetical protein